MNKFCLTFGLFCFLATSAVAQSSTNTGAIEKGSQSGKKSEKVQSNTNPQVTTEELPSDIPTMNYTGDPTQNFYTYVQEKTEWFQQHPEYLDQGKYLTRISKTYKEGLPANVQSYIEQHESEFEIVGK